MNDIKKFLKGMTKRGISPELIVSSACLLLLIIDKVELKVNVEKQKEAE